MNNSHVLFYPVKKSAVLFFFSLLLLLSASAFAGKEPQLSSVRTEFYKAIEEESTAEHLFAVLSSAAGSGNASTDNVLFAYYGAVETLLGKHAINPYTKWNKLQQGLSKLSTAIQRQPENIEIRFLRFSILHYIPSFLGYGDERESDLQTLYRLFTAKAESDLPAPIYRGAVQFLLQSGRLNTRQNDELRKLLASSEK